MRPRLSSLAAAAVLRVTIAAALLLALGACGSAPAVRLHTLMSSELVAPNAADGARSGAATIAIVLEPIRVPAQVDQPQWLVRRADDSLAVLEQERWASSLRDELREALLDQLATGFGAVDARGLPAGAGAPVRIAVDVRRFESLPGREARSEGSWTLSGLGASPPAFHCEWLIREPAPGPTDALASAHRRAVARLGAAIGAALVAAKSGQPSICPPLDDRR